MSGSGDRPPIVVIPDGLAALLNAVTAVAEANTGRVALVGGLAVAARVPSGANPHRATLDIDLVVEDTDPSVETVLASSGATNEGTLYLADTKVDIIVTLPVTDEDLDGLGDDQRLFLVGHRWALETADAMTLRRLGSASEVTLAVGTPAGLFAAKSGAAGFPRPGRRATKHGGDLYDLLRLAEVHNREGSLAHELVLAPGDIAPIIAGVIRREILANPARARAQMAAATDRPIDLDQVIDVFEALVEDLERPG